MSALLFVVGFIFSVLVLQPADKVTNFILKKKGIATSQYSQDSRRLFGISFSKTSDDQRESLYWSVLAYMCAIFYLGEWALYDLVKNQENSFTSFIIMAAAASLLMWFRVWMIKNEDGKAVNSLKSFGRFVLYIWVGVIAVSAVVMLFVFLFG
jgi:hypothetical protein